MFLTLFIISCGTKKETVLQNVNRKGQPFDISQDTIVERHFKNNGKLSFEKYMLNEKRLFLKSYYYKKDGSWEVHQGKTFFNDEGFSNAYYPNGKLKIVSQFQNGKQNGKYISYYPNGMRQCDCNYEKGKRSGLQVSYWDNGQLFSKDEYQNGLLWNIKERYHKDGEVLEFGTLNNGNGILKTYKDDGKLENIEYYKNGIKVKTEKIKR